LCDLLKDRTDQLSCYSGTFMENVVGGLSGAMGHITTYLSNDPHYPCNLLSDMYLQACYSYQTSRMVVLFSYDFSKVAAACAEAPSIARYTCYQSMGHDVGSATRGAPQRAIASCANVGDPNHRMDCLSGAVQDWFWDVSGAADALGFCALIKEGEQKRRCYRVLVDRSASLYATTEEVAAFCGRVEAAYRDACPQA
jgi:hypothetical protein